MPFLKWEWQESNSHATPQTLTKRTAILGTQAARKSHQLPEILNIFNYLYLFVYLNIYSKSGHLMSHKTQSWESSVCLFTLSSRDARQVLDTVTMGWRWAGKWGFQSTAGNLSFQAQRGWCALSPKGMSTEIDPKPKSQSGYSLANFVQRQIKRCYIF